MTAPYAEMGAVLKPATGASGSGSVSMGNPAVAGTVVERESCHGKGPSQTRLEARDAA